MTRFAMAIMFALFLSSCRHDSQQKAPGQPYASRDGLIVTLHPSEITFRVPPQWLEWNDQFHNNFHLSRNELDSVENGAGEWDTEYGQVVNAALPFGDCVAHVGGEGWGRNGVSFADVQMRAYITELGKRDVLDRIHGAAFSAARRASKSSSSSKSLGELAPAASVNEAQEGDWMKSVVQYPLWYGDYGGTARVRFYLTSIGTETLVLVFMGGDAQEVESILHSVSIRHK